MRGGLAMTAATLDARRFRALQQDWSSEDLARFFLLATEDMREVRTCRGAANRLGFAHESAPPSFAFLSSSRSEPYPCAHRPVRCYAAQCPSRGPSLVWLPDTADARRAQRSQIRGYLNLRPYSHGEDDPHLAE